MNRAISYKKKSGGWIAVWLGRMVRYQGLRYAPFIAEAMSAVNAQRQGMLIDAEDMGESLFYYLFNYLNS